MAIKINLQEVETELFCSSKWWGDPDLPADMPYPTVPVHDPEEGDYDYPLTFLCQIDCEDIAALDPEGVLPHQGMLYFFAAVDEFLDEFESPVHGGQGRWEKGLVLVKYTPSINFETFRSAILVDDEDNSLTSPPLKITFEACPDDAPCTRLLGLPSGADVLQEMPSFRNLLQIASGTAGLRFGDDGMLDILIAEADAVAGRWKKAIGYLSSL